MTKLEAIAEKLAAIRKFGSLNNTEQDLSWCVSRIEILETASRIILRDKCRCDESVGFFDCPKCIIDTALSELESE